MPLKHITKLEIEELPFLELCSRVIRDLSRSFVSWVNASSRDLPTSLVVDRLLTRYNTSLVRVSRIQLSIRLSSFFQDKYCLLSLVASESWLGGSSSIRDSISWPSLMDLFVLSHEIVVCELNRDNSVELMKSLCCYDWHFHKRN